MRRTGGLMRGREERRKNIREGHSGFSFRCFYFSPSLHFFFSAISFFLSLSSYLHSWVPKYSKFWSRLERTRLLGKRCIGIQSESTSDFLNIKLTIAGWCWTINLTTGSQKIRSFLSPPESWASCLEVLLFCLFPRSMALEQNFPHLSAIKVRYFFVLLC